MLAEITLSNQQTALAVLGFFVTLIGYHFTIGKYIREQAGIKEVNKVELSPTNEVSVSMKIDSLPVSRFEKFEIYVHEKHHEFANDLNGIKLELNERTESAAEEAAAVRDIISVGLGKIADRQSADFKELDRKRSVSIGTLHTHLTETDVKLAGVQTTVHRNERSLDKIETQIAALGNRLADKIESLLKGN